MIMETEMRCPFCESTNLGEPIGAQVECFDCGSYFAVPEEESD